MTSEGYKDLKVSQELASDNLSVVVVRTATTIITMAVGGDRGRGDSSLEAALDGSC